MLAIKSLSVSYADQEIISDFSYTWQPGTINIISGANGSGKSTLFHAIAGLSSISITQGSITYNNSLFNEKPTFERARDGLFLSLQNPPTLTGVSIQSFFKEAYRARYGSYLSVDRWNLLVHEAWDFVGLPFEYLQRSVHDKFSGGEKKRFEIAHWMIMNPSLVLLDEIDSGLDRDAILMLKACIMHMHKKNPSLIVIIITHAPALFTDLKIDSHVSLEKSRAV